jgi:hypothetical protein
MKAKYSILERLNIGALYDKFLGLPPRQQLVAIVVSIAFALLLVLLPFSLASSKIAGLRKELRENGQAMESVVKTISRYNAVVKKYELMKNKISSGYVDQLQSTIADLAEKSGISITSYGTETKDVARSELLSESYIEVRPEKASLKQIVDFIYSIENAGDKILRVTELSMKKRYDDPKLFDISKMRVSTFKVVEAKKEKETTGKGRRTK